MKSLTKKELLDRIEDLERINMSKQERIGELDKQVTGALDLIDEVLQLKIKNRWQLKHVNKILRTFMFTKQDQAIRQLKLEIIAQINKNFKLSKQLEAIINMQGELKELLPEPKDAL